MKRLIIADSHVGTLPGDADAMEDLLRRASDAGFEEIIYLGDTFQYLIGMSKFWTASVRKVLAVWDDLRADGMKIHLIEGNRDFFLSERELASRVDSSGLSFDFSSAGVHYRLIHGDKVNQRDFQYLFWSRLSKSLPARVWARWLPSALAVRIVRTMEARLATTNRKYRYTKPVEALRENAASAFSEGVDVMLWGHFHTFWEYSIGHRLAMVVPAWLESRTVLIVDDKGAWSFADSELVAKAEVGP
ncbi:MAG: metallophosphoesterase family protein [Thermoanaerobaculales bacterium]|nr:metallophosphoesterase family protein [Thermoanaerobaculales bacterium]